MNGKVHSAAGLIFGLGGAYVLYKTGLTQNLLDVGLNAPLYESITQGDAIVAGTVVATSVLGSLLPDIDHPTSTLSKRFWLLALPYRILQFIFGKFKATKHFVGHRGITHSLLFLAIPLIVAFFLRTNPWVVASMIGISVGILSHLIMDMLNPMGVPLLLPFARKKFRLLPKKLCYSMK